MLCVVPPLCIAFYVLLACSAFIFVGFCIFLVLAKLAKASLINKNMLLINICLLIVTKGQPGEHGELSIVVMHFHLDASRPP